MTSHVETRATFGFSFSKICSPHQSPNEVTCGDGYTHKITITSWAGDDNGTNQITPSRGANCLSRMGNGYPMWPSRIRETHDMFSHTNVDEAPPIPHKMTHAPTVIPPADPRITSIGKHLFEIQPTDFGTSSITQGGLEQARPVPPPESSDIAVDQQVPEIASAEFDATSITWGWKDQV